MQNPGHFLTSRLRRRDRSHRATTTPGRGRGAQRTAGRRRATITAGRGTTVSPGTRRRAGSTSGITIGSASVAAGVGVGAAAAVEATAGAAAEARAEAGVENDATRSASTPRTVTQRSGKTGTITARTQAAVIRTKTGTNTDMKRKRRGHEREILEFVFLHTQAKNYSKQNICFNAFFPYKSLFLFFSTIDKTL